MDEPALREGLPLKRARWESHLMWAVRAFRLSTVVASPGTQIVTHLCYSEFADILHVRPAPSQPYTAACYLGVSERARGCAKQPHFALCWVPAGSFHVHLSTALH